MSRLKPKLPTRNIVQPKVSANSAQQQFSDFMNTQNQNTSQSSTANVSLDPRQNLAKLKEKYTTSETSEVEISKNKESYSSAQETLAENWQDIKEKQGENLEAVQTDVMQVQTNSNVTEIPNISAEQTVTEQKEHELSRSEFSESESENFSSKDQENQPKNQPKKVWQMQVDAVKNSVTRQVEENLYSQPETEREVKPNTKEENLDRQDSDSTEPTKSTNLETEHKQVDKQENTVDTFKTGIENLQSDKEQTNKQTNQENWSSTEDLQKLQTELAQKEAQIQALQAEIDKQKNDILRLLADIDNLHKQSDIDQKRASKYGRTQIVNCILNFLNTLYLAFKFKPETQEEAVKKFIETLNLSFKQVLAELETNGVTILIPEIGSLFDPKHMVAVNSTEQVDGLDIRVKQVVSLGYSIDGQLVKAASVLI